MDSLLNLSESELQELIINFELIPEDSIDIAFNDIIKILQRKRFTVQELVALLSNLIFIIGSSIEGFSGVTPPPEEIRKMNLMHPEKLGYALMQQGLEMRYIWTNNIEKLEKNNKL